MKNKKDRWAMLTPEEVEQNVVQLNCQQWREAKEKRDKAREKREFTQHFNSVGDKLEGLRVRV